MTASERQHIRAERDRLERQRSGLGENPPNLRGGSFAKRCYEAAGGDFLLALELACLALNQHRFVP